MQEPKEEKDEELIKKLLELINNPPPPPASPMEQMMASMTDEERAAAMAQMGGDGHSHGGASARSGARATASTPSRMIHYLALVRHWSNDANMWYVCMYE